MIFKGEIVLPPLDPPLLMVEKGIGTLLKFLSAFLHEIILTPKKTIKLNKFAKINKYSDPRFLHSFEPRQILLMIPPTKGFQLSGSQKLLIGALGLLKKKLLERGACLLEVKDKEKGL